MDAADLDHRARTRSGCIPPELAARLLERGHADVVEHQAARGEWFCAHAWARALGDQGRQADALQVLAPYAATGWWTAAAATAELLEGWGRPDEAIEITRTRVEAGHPSALEGYARLLARHGRADEAFDLLVPHVDDWLLATAVVDIASVAGRDEETAALLAGRVRAGHRCDGPWCCRGLDSDTALGLLAEIRERQGRTDEAIALLRRRQITSVNNRDQLADLLARHDRVGELRAYAALDGHEEAVRRLAELLEEGGELEGAIAVYGQADGPAAHDPNSAYELARLLARHGRGTEAIAVMRGQADAHPGDDWILHALSELYLDQGRPADGLAHLDALDARRGGERDWDVYWMRLPLIAACDGVDEAVRQALAHPEGDTWYAAEHIARLLADSGRTEEAVAVLQRHARRNSHVLAGHLIDLGRVDEAVALLLHTNPPPPPAPTARPGADGPSF
ncbi:tetratricopeptide repeat protein [Streptomyces sp. 130]|uniref:tetratricopeptide repeat protein n=1 Tax=Streptomyces sp. 130 TaxID=2591006 RepID=UPI00118021D4|nr:tetratricopeptide repeat protein [Streptomyces sp. 130]TRV81001.1 tetratricopeptide repeat protein [Streptomyces sp. 130]